MKFVVYSDVDRRWYWDLQEIAGETVATSSMGFIDKAHAVRNLHAVRLQAAQCLIFDRLGNLDSDAAHES